MNRLMASGLLPGDFRDSSVVHVRDALRVMEDARVVRHDYDRAIGMDGVAREQRHDRFAAGMIQGCGGLVDLDAQHRQIPVRPIQESSDDRDERRLAAPARTDQEAQLAEARVELDAAERLDARVALAEMLPHRAAGNRQAHRKTSAGSSTSTRRMLRMLAIATTNRMHVPVRPAHCHKRTIPRVASLCRKISKNVAAIPVPRPKPSAATLTACSSIIPTSRGLVTPMAFSAPNCFRFSTVNR